jgi:hypothetical protein
MIIWKLEGQDYVLDDGSITLFHGHDGMGLAPIRRLEERGPLQHGVTDRGYRYDSRTIILTLGIKGKDLEDFYEKREQLVKLFSARNKPGKLRVVIGNRIREIKAHAISDSLQFSDSNREYLYQRAAVALKCPDPRWYDPTINSVNFNISGGADTFVIPFEVPFKLGASTIDATKPIVYSGNVKSYPTIRIEGPITDPVISNVETGHKLDFTGITIPAGTTYIIDLGYADNTVETSTGENKISELTTDSDLVEFCIDPDYGGGINNIRVTGSSVSEGTNVMIIYYDYYIGI